jgi:serine/threonine protein kinase
MLDRTSTVWAVRCIFLLTGQPPFTEGTLVQRLIAHQTKTPPAIVEFRRDVPEELNQILSKMLAKNRKERTSTAAEVVDQLTSFLKRTESQNELDATPIILKRVTSANRGADDEQVNFVDSHSGTRQEGETTSAENIGTSTAIAASLGTKTPDVAGTPVFLPAFAALLRQIKADCDASSSLGKDARSGRLLELVTELAQLEASVPTPAVVPVVEKPIEPVPTRFTIKADVVPDFSSIQSNAPSKWPAEDTVLNDIAIAGFRFDPASITTRSNVEVDTRLMIEQLLAAVDKDSENSTGDSGIPLVTSIDLPHRKIGNKVAKPIKEERSSVVLWSMVGLGVLAAVVVLAIVYSML